MLRGMSDDEVSILIVISSIALFLLFFSSPLLVGSTSAIPSAGDTFLVGGMVRSRPSAGDKRVYLTTGSGPLPHMHHERAPADDAASSCGRVHRARYLFEDRCLCWLSSNISSRTWA